MIFEFPLNQIIFDVIYLICMKKSKLKWLILEEI